MCVVNKGKPNGKQARETSFSIVANYRTFVSKHPSKHGGRVFSCFSISMLVNVVHCDVWRSLDN